MKALFAPLAMKIGGGMIALLLLYTGFLHLQLAAEKRHSAKVEARLNQEIAANQLFAERVRSKAEELTRKASELARNVETQQNQVSRESSNDYQERLAALRRRYDALRLRTGAGGADPGRSGADPMSGLPASSGGPDAEAQDYSFRCEADAVQLDALQRWVRGQAEIPHP